MTVPMVDAGPATRSLRSPGAPGVLFRRVAPGRPTTEVRLDECGFVGVAPRGPAWVPWAEPGREPLDAIEWLAAPRRRSVAVAVDSWDDYVRRFGTFDGPGLLPDAVAAFFEQGGRRAHVVRIVAGARHDAAGRSGVATGRFPSGVLTTDGGDPVTFVARDPGGWGDRLVVRLRATAVPALIDPDRSTTTRLWLAPGTDLEAGATVDVRLGNGTSERRRVERTDWKPRPPERRIRDRVATLATPVASTPRSAQRVVIDVTVAEVDADGRPLDQPADRTEEHADVSLDPRHRRWLAWVLVTESALVEPHADWADAALDLAPAVTDTATAPFAGGLDRFREIIHDDIVPAAWTPGDEPPLAGVHALAEVGALGLFAVPDLYAAGPPAEASVPEIISLAGPCFAPCVEVAQPPLPAPEDDLEGLRLDPAHPDDLERITALQVRLVDLADHLRGPIALLDVPHGLSVARQRAWRARFASAFAAAYHPWLVASRQDARRPGLCPVNPSAVAAGIIADRERRAGAWTGPANELARQILDVREQVSARRHDELHPLGINVYLAERDGIRLTAGRTLSVDPSWRQLSVRRLVTLIERTLQANLTWAVFEPNGPALWSIMRHSITSYLDAIWRAGGLAGASPSEAFFVRCDATTNPPSTIDAGRVVALVGVAPVEPLEFVLVELRCDDTGITAGVGRG